MSENHWIVAFPSAEEYRNGREALVAADVPHVNRDRAPARDAYSYALSVEQALKGQAYRAFQSADVLLSGTYDAPQPLLVTAPSAEGLSLTDTFVRGAAVTFVDECVADPAKIRLIARLFADVAEVMPYLNAVLSNATYVPGGPYLTFMREHRMVTLYPQRVAIAKADDIDDGWRTLLWLCDLIDDTHARRGEIEPNYQTRQRPSALQIYSWLPKTNCRDCGERTCLAFAALLLQGKHRIEECKPLFTEEHAKLRERMLEIVKVLGG